jgi:hypothetical protein
MYLHHENPVDVTSVFLINNIDQIIFGIVFAVYSAVDLLQSKKTAEGVD